MAKSVEELFGGQPQQPKASGGGLFNGLLVIVLIVVLAMLSWQRFSQFGQQDHDQGRQEQKEERVAGKTAIFIHERNPQSIDHDLLLREVQAAGIEFRALDDDITDAPVPQLIQYAKAKGVEPPFVVLTGTDDRPAKVVAWPKSFDEFRKWRGK